AEETNTVEAWRNRSVSYERLGDIYIYEDNTAKAKEYYEKSLAIREQLAKETNTVEAFHDLAISYYRMSLVCQGEEKRGYLIKALDIMNALCEACPDIAEFKQHRNLFQRGLDSLDEDETE
ncbi:MAG: tetratricopeptide repeat protein, partial [Clostridia bacterium]|nr:tetratricopeptide repeat protein [Clostridia bacterium]